MLFLNDKAAVGFHRFQSKNNGVMSFHQSFKVNHPFFSWNVTRVPVCNLSFDKKFPINLKYTVMMDKAVENALCHRTFLKDILLGEKETKRFSHRLCPTYCNSIFIPAS